MKESKLYLFKGINLGKATPLRRMIFVCREKESYDKNGIGIWWKKYMGLGISGKPDKGFKYLMVGLTLINLKVWVDITWVGKI